MITNDSQRYFRKGPAAVILTVLVAASVAHAQSTKMTVPGPPGTLCGGCTTGGLSCFGMNTCASDCLAEIELSCDTCEKIGQGTCCPSCTAPCRANKPCLGDRPYRIVADSCPSEPAASQKCQYYARAFKCKKSKCKYYDMTLHGNASTCEHAPDTETSACIRECLQVKDAMLTFPADKTKDGCPNVNFIVRYHEECFQQCGIPDVFPSTFFRWLGNHDGQ